MDVKTLCLGALTLGDASGYEIRKMFDEGPFGQFYDASYGSIYPALNVLLKDKLVTVTEMAQEKRPDKKVYSLTATGLSLFKEALSEPPTKDKVRSEHLVRLFFADFMSKQALTEVYESYLLHFQSQTEHLRSLNMEGALPGRGFVCGFGLTFYEAMTTYLIENRDTLLNVCEPISDESDSQLPKRLGEDNV